MKLNERQRKEIIDSFMFILWNNIDRLTRNNEFSEKEKLMQFAHTILVTLDGFNAQFKGDIDKISESMQGLLHEEFYKFRKI